MYCRRFLRCLLIIIQILLLTHLSIYISPTKADESYDATLRSIYPALGPKSGGSRILLVGNGYGQGHVHGCYFAETYVKGYVLSTTEMECITPMREIESELHVYLACQEDIQCNDKLVYTFHDEVKVNQIIPNSGWAQGETVVNVYGSGFIFSPSLCCKFGHTILPGSFVSTTEITCVSPPYKAGKVEVTVSNNCVEFSSNGVQFHYLAEVQLTSIIPSYGKLSGSTVIILNGEGLHWNSSLMCRFGTMIVAAQITDFDSIGCTSPLTSEAGIVSFEISMNGIDFTFSGLSYEYVEDIVMTSVSPALGPKSGYSTVIISGYHFRASSELKCKFGETLVSGRFVSESQIDCISPVYIPVSFVDKEQK